MKEKGFTLVELLGVLIILSAILAIITISVGKIVTSSQKNIADIQKNSIENAAKVYYLTEGMDNNASCVSVSRLLNSGYLEGEEIINPETGDELKGFVSITFASNKYSYRYQEESCMPCTLATGSDYSVGNKVTCDTESFYIMGSDSNNLTMVAEKPITLESSPVQSASATATTFATTVYWNDYSGDVFEDDEDVETEGSKLVHAYDSNSTLYDYINNYKTYLTSIDVLVSSARLMTYEEAKDLGVCYNTETCSTYPTWMNNFSAFWLGDALTDSGTVETSGFVVEDSSVQIESISSNFYVRPVVVISKYNF